MYSLRSERGPLCAGEGEEKSRKMSDTDVSLTSSDDRKRFSSKGPHQLNSCELLQSQGARDFHVNNPSYAVPSTVIKFATEGYYHGHDLVVT